MAAEPLARPVANRRSTHRPARRATAANRRGSQPRVPVPVVTVIIPTYNEAETIDVLLDLVIAALGDTAPVRPFELIVVDDDSADGTWRLADARAEADARVRVVRRIGRRGLSSAVLAGMAVARGDVLVVLDADLQHDERRIPDLVDAVLDGADVAIGSREVAGGGYGPFGRRRLALSRLGAATARRAIGIDTTDPMSGFFAVSADRHRTVAGRINPRGFKILLEFLARGSEPRVTEIGYQFRARAGGTTKFSGAVGVAFAVNVIELAVTRRWGRRRRSGERGGR